MFEFIASQLILQTSYFLLLFLLFCLEIQLNLCKCPSLWNGTDSLQSIVKVRKEFRIKINTDKVMQKEKETDDIILDGINMEQVKSFQYLRSFVLGMEAEQVK